MTSDHMSREYMGKTCQYRIDLRLFSFLLFFRLRSIFFFFFRSLRRQLPSSLAMFSASVRGVARVGSSITSRTFSTSTTAYAAEVKSLGVIGAGQMVSMLLYCNFSSGQILNGMQGLGIALVAASKAQVPVTLIDNSQASLDKGLTFAGMLDTV